jgi:hypothetical protein
MFFEFCMLSMRVLKCTFILHRHLDTLDMYAHDKLECTNRMNISMHHSVPLLCCYWLKRWWKGDEKVTASDENYVWRCEQSVTNILLIFCFDIFVWLLYESINNPIHCLWFLGRGEKAIKTWSNYLCRRILLFGSQCCWRHLPSAPQLPAPLSRPWTPSCSPRWMLCL